MYSVGSMRRESKQQKNLGKEYFQKDIVSPVASFPVHYNVFANTQPVQKKGYVVIRRFAE